MGVNLFTTKKVLWIAVGFILILAAVIFGSNKEIPEIDSGIKPHLGEWKITEFTGYVNYVESGKGKWCEPKNERFYPIIDEDLTFIKFMELRTETKFKNIPREMDETYWNETINSKGIFIFQFSFENGGKTNKGLEPYGEPFHQTEVIKGLKTFEIGYWGDTSELESTQFGTLSKDLGNGLVVIGQEMSATGGGGKGSFEVVGYFKGEDRIEGQWVLKEVAGSWGALKTYCPWESNGSGTWVAVRK